MESTICNDRQTEFCTTLLVTIYGSVLNGATHWFAIKQFGAQLTAWRWTYVSVR